VPRRQAVGKGKAAPKVAAGRDAYLEKTRKTRDELQLERLSAAELAVRREFSKRLQLKLAERGWNGSELARQASKHMSGGRFGRDMVSKYLRGVALPYPSSLTALCRALRCKPEDLMPPEVYGTISTVAPEVDMQTVGDGTAWLRINKRVPFKVAVEVMALLKGHAE
jgi:transcriptional regulator with XRE-family HTH domain